MEFDLTDQPEIVQQAAGYGLQAWDLAQSWVLSPAAWSQFALLVAAYVLAVLVAARLRGILTRLLTPPPEAANLLARGRRAALVYLPLLLPLLAYAFNLPTQSLRQTLYVFVLVIICPLAVIIRLESFGLDPFTAPNLH